MTVYLVGAGPGDPGLITRRGAEVLGRADVVLYDRLVDPRLLELAPPGARRVDVGKRPGEPRFQDEVNALLVEYARSSAVVVRLKGGDPFVFGRGGEEAEALLGAGIDFEVVPGVSSAVAAPAAAGVPVTHRGLSSSVTVVTGHVGDPAAPGAVDWESLGRAGGTLVVLMGMAARAEIARRLVAAGRRPDTPVVVVHRGTTPTQATVRTTLAGLAGVELGPPCTIVIGAVAALDLRPAPRGPLAGTSVVVTRGRGQSGPLVSALSGAGAAVVELPVIAVADPSDGGAGLRAAAATAAGFDWVVFTSVNAVERFVAALPDVRVLGTVRLAAVGSATAGALARHHLVPDLVPEEATAEGLVAAMGRAATAPAVAVDGTTPAVAVDGTEAAGGRGGAAPGATVLFPRALEVRPVLAAGLRQAGFEVTEVVAYRTVRAGLHHGVTAETVEGALGADVVTFTSPSTVAGFLALADGRALPPVVACIGPVTADAARGAGVSVDVVAAEHSAAGLVAALVAHVSDRPGPEPPEPGGAAPA